jgi:hypothetical protein
MMAEPDDLPDELTSETVRAELERAGIAPTLPSLRELIANARAREHEAERHRTQWPLLWLVPAHVNEEVARRAADHGVLVAERIGGRWFCAVSNMQAWLKRTGRWFKSGAEEQQWRKMLVNRKVQ